MPITLRGIQFIPSNDKKWLNVLYQPICQRCMYTDVDFILLYEVFRHNMPNLVKNLNFIKYELKMNQSNLALML